jgi:hypothetical protein
MSPSRLRSCLVVALLSLVTTAVAAQAPLTASPSRARGDYTAAIAPSAAPTASRFTMSADVIDSLRALWALSIAERQEEVACLGGTVDSGRVTITRMMVLRHAVADTFTIGAGESIERCGAPEWLGTVHTHIARLNGQPYITFSGADRGVMAIWRNRWNALGVFCLLYDADKGWCEAGSLTEGEIELAPSAGVVGAAPPPLRDANLAGSQAAGGAPRSEAQ